LVPLATTTSIPRHVLSLPETRIDTACILSTAVVLGRPERIQRKCKDNVLPLTTRRTFRESKTSITKKGVGTKDAGRGSNRAGGLSLFHTFEGGSMNGTMAAGNCALSLVDVNQNQTTNSGFPSDLLDFYG
jgi:hypothetical protein